VQKIYLFSTTPHKDVVHVPSLSIKYLQPQIDFLQYNYFIITSKQTIAALQKYENFDLLPALCVSEKTALAYKEIGGKVLCTGDGYGKSLVAKIKEFSQETQWLYPRAKIVASDFAQQARENGFCIDEAIVYVSSCSQAIRDIKMEQDGVLIFTSPSSVKCFLQTHTILKGHKVIVIGHTTAHLLPEDVKPYISEINSVEHCVKIAKKMQE